MSSSSYLTKVDTDQHFQHGSLFEYLPTDAIIHIFKSLKVTDVISCQNICSQTKSAAEYYFKRNFKKFIISPATLAAVSPQSDPNDLQFIDDFLAAIGPFIQTLIVNFVDFPSVLIQPLSLVVLINCNRVRNLTIISQPGIEITMPSTQCLETLIIKNCFFEPLVESGKTLRTMSFSQTEGSKATDLLTLSNQFPGIIDLTVYTNGLNYADFVGITSLRDLQTLNIELSKPNNKTELHELLYNCNLENLLIMLQSLDYLREFKLTTPFFKRLSVEVVDIHVQSLRLRTNVILTVNALDDFEFNGPYGVDPTLMRHCYLEPEDLRSMRSDLDGLKEITASIDFVGADDMVCLQKLVKLDVLRLTLCGYEEENRTMFDDVLRSLALGAGRGKCHLKELTLNADFTYSVEVDQLSSIKAFLRAANELTSFTVINCSPELMEMQTFMADIQLNVKIVFVLSVEKPFDNFN